MGEAAAVGLLTLTKTALLPSETRAAGEAPFALRGGGDGEGGGGGGGAPLEPSGRGRQDGPRNVPRGSHFPLYDHAQQGQQHRGRGTGGGNHGRVDGDSTHGRYQGHGGGGFQGQHRSSQEQQRRNNRQYDPPWWAPKEITQATSSSSSGPVGKHRFLILLASLVNLGILGSFL